jgi:hypothetical protein
MIPVVYWYAENEIQMHDLSLPWMQYVVIVREEDDTTL